MNHFLVTAIMGSHPCRGQRKDCPSLQDAQSHIQSAHLLTSNYFQLIYQPNALQMAEKQIYKNLIRPLVTGMWTSTQTSTHTHTHAHTHTHKYVCMCLCLRNTQPYLFVYRFVLLKIWLPFRMMKFAFRFSKMLSICHIWFGSFIPRLFGPPNEKDNHLFCLCKLMCTKALVCVCLQYDTCMCACASVCVYVCVHARCCNSLHLNHIYAYELVSARMRGTSQTSKCLSVKWPWPKAQKDKNIWQRARNMEIPDGRRILRENVLRDTHRWEDKNRKFQFERPGERIAIITVAIQEVGRRKQTGFPTKTSF